MLDKFDTYNFVANLIPGALLAHALWLAGLPLPSTQNLIAFVIVAFTLGAICNRLGSLALDPFLRWIKALPPKNYQAYVSASRTDRKLDVIVENANLYRTFATAGVLYFILRLGYKLTQSIGLSEIGATSITIILAVVVFTLAYRKEDSYITQRVANQPKEDEEIIETPSTSPPSP